MSIRLVGLSSSLLFLAVLSPVAYAGCTSYASQGSAQHLSFGTVKVSHNAKVGDVLAEATTVAWTGGSGKCSSPRRTATLGIFSKPSAIGNKTYETNIPGIGIRLFHYGFGDNNNPVPDDFQYGWNFSAQVIRGHFRAQLVKTAEKVGSGDLTNGTVAQAGFDGHRQIWADLVNTQIVPEKPTCAFAAKQVRFDLGQIDGSMLLSQGYSAWANQSLVTTGCTGATEMLLTFAGAADESAPSLFRLDNKGAGAAGGVAVELRSVQPDEQALPNAAPMALPTTDEGRAYGFRARYRSTGEAITPGIANASVTVNVAYR